VAWSKTGALLSGDGRTPHEVVLKAVMRVPCAGGRSSGTCVQCSGVVRACVDESDSELQCCMAQTRAGEGVCVCACVRVCIDAMIQAREQGELQRQRYMACMHQLTICVYAPGGVWCSYTARIQYKMRPWRPWEWRGHEPSTRCFAVPNAAKRQEVTFAFAKYSSRSHSPSHSHSSILRALTRGPRRHMRNGVIVGLLLSSFIAAARPPV
jgi:hypothetical protein